MESVIIKPQNEILRQYVEYFLFFRKTNDDFLTYTTFPNNNLCLAIYKESSVCYINKNGENSCTINQGKTNFTCRFYGFHKTPFKVDISTHLDQSCIVFRPSALRAFTKESYDELMLSNNVLDIFSSIDTVALEQVFEASHLSERAEILESMLLRNLRFEISYKLKEALLLISKNNGSNLSVEVLSKMLGISIPTLFRLFKNNLGQGPKTYLKTIRFRNVLNETLNGKDTLTSIAHLNQYYDQAHFINDFKLFSGYSPKQLYDKVSVHQNDLAWIYNKK